MKLSPEQRRALTDLGERVLQAFEVISGNAREQLLTRGSQSTSYPSQPVAVQQTLARIAKENRESLQILQREPAIACVEVQWLDTKDIERLYICRASSAGIGSPEGKLVSYRAPLGRLAELPAGEDDEIVLPGRRRCALIRERVQLHPALLNEGWDSHNNHFDLIGLQVAIESIRRLLQHEKQLLGLDAAARIDFVAQMLAEGEARKVYLDQRRRKTVERMELRDQPILDQYQGLIFRMPLDKQVFLLGPPGAGKTTTLIRRLAQKRTEEALTPGESEKLDQLGFKADFLGDDGWAMFSPTELLKLYVREAFNREGVPASSINLRTWEAERISLGRDVLRILKGASAGRFMLSENDDALLECSSSGVAALHDHVAREVDSEVLARCSEALEWMRNSGDTSAVDLLKQIRAQFGIGAMTLDTVHAFAKRDQIFKTSIARISGEIEEQERTFANQFLLPEPNKRLKELVEALRRQGSASSQPVEDDEDEEDVAESPADEVSFEDAKKWDEAAAARMLLNTVRRLAVNAAEGRSRPARGDFAVTLGWLGDRIPASGSLSGLGRKIQLQRKLRILDGAARFLVFGVPAIYGRLRRRSMQTGKWFHPQATSVTRQTALAPSEVDLLILVMLRNARRALEKLGETNWLKEIGARYLPQVFVDEATDFSAVQLACLLELAHPKLRAWFACGDFKQRITRYGIESAEEFHWITDRTGVKEIEVQEITIEYRQSARLKMLAEALASGSKPKSAAVSSEDEDPAPLLAERARGGELASWLATRILEVERRVGMLPSVAIFVDGEDRIDGMVEAVRPKLAEHNVRVVGCRDGRDVGNAQEVRVFNIQHIKGLEFEAVFFVGVDALAKRIPDLFQRYIYVGLTRAATFLGITCEESLPTSLDFVRSLFSAGTWT